jgi:hypothetical protein
MEWLFGLEVVGLMFVLRLVVPIVMMLLLIRALHRLDTKWQATA